MKNLIAQDAITNPALGPELTALTGEGFFQKFLPMAIGLAFIIGALIFFSILIIGAIQWTTSGGDKQALESAKGKITNAFVGLVLLFAAFAVIKLIEGFFGIDILLLDIGALEI